MSRSERRNAARLVAVLLGALVACAPEEPARTKPADPPPLIQAEAAPLPDFHRFVVGDLEEPPNPDRDPFAETRTQVRSPVRGRVAHRPTAARLELRGIVERDGERVALFQRGSVRVGETIAGWKVEEIGDRTVILRRGDQRRSWSL